MSFNSYDLKIKARTWARDSYGLYDYETSDYQQFGLKTTKNGLLIRKDNKVDYIDNISISTLSELKSENSEVLAEITETPSGIKIFPNKYCENKRFWQVVDKEDSSKGFPLSVSQVIKIGRIMFKIKQIKIQSLNKHDKEPNESIIDSIKQHMDKFDQKPPSSSEKNSICGNKVCKICLMEKSDQEDDPLITPCKCSGSVSHVHLKCLQEWVKTKLKMHRNKMVISIYWKNLNCELCSAKLPIHIEHEGQEYIVIPIGRKISGSYMIMESFSKDKNPTGLHIFDLSLSQEFKLGRANNCDLKLDDISVSRVHALITQDDGTLYLKDNKSKFGTLLQGNAPMYLGEDAIKSSWIQFGRTILKFSLKKPWHAFIPCFGPLLRNPPYIAPQTKKNELQLEETIPDEKDKRYYYIEELE